MFPEPTLSRQADKQCAPLVQLINTLVIPVELLDRTLASQAGFKIDGSPVVGGQSCVYRAYHSVTDRMVALKIYREAQSSQHILREAAALAAINHPNVARFMGMGYFGDFPYVATQWIEGERLSDFLLRHGSLSIGDALKVAHDIAAGLGAVHQLNMVHGDVSPANVLVKPGGDAVIIDFGLGGSHCQATKTEDTSLAGTIRYIAPETILGDPPTFASDQYAVGILLYEMISGCWPFLSDNANRPPHLASALHHHLYTEADPLIEQCPGVDAVLDAVVCKALNKDPAHRHDDMIEFDAALYRAMRPVPECLASPLSISAPSDGKKSRISRKKAIQPLSTSRSVFAWCTPVKTLFTGFVILGALAGTGALFAYAETKGYLSPDNHLKNPQQTANRETQSGLPGPLLEIKNMVTQAKGSGCNLMPNPYFNEPLSDNFYKDAKNPDVVMIVDDANRESSPLLKVGDANQYGLYGQIIPIDPKDQYIFSASVYSSDTVEEAKLIVSWLDQHWQIMENQGQSINVQDASGPVVFDDISPPARARYAVPSVFKNASRGTLLLDDLVFISVDKNC